jgi:hypothetical protein
MSGFTRAYFSYGVLITLVLPVLIVVTSAMATRRMSGYRWVVHVLTFVGVFLTLPVFIWLGAVLDPTSLELPGPMDGFVYLVCLLVAIASIIGYAVYAVAHALLNRGTSQSLPAQPFR